MKRIIVILMVLAGFAWAQQHDNHLGSSSAPTDSLRDGTTTITGSVVWYRNAAQTDGSLTLSVHLTQVAGSFTTVTPYVRIFTKPNDTSSYSQWYALTDITAIPSDANEAVVYCVSCESWWTYNYGYQVKYVTGAGTGNWRVDVESWGMAK